MGFKASTSVSVFVFYNGLSENLRILGFSRFGNTFKISFSHSVWRFKNFPPFAHCLISSFMDSFLQPYLHTRHFKWELERKPENAERITDGRDASPAVRGAGEGAVFSALPLPLPGGVAAGTASVSPEWGDAWLPPTLGQQQSLVVTPFPGEAVQRKTSGQMSWGASVGLTNMVTAGV